MIKEIVARAKNMVITSHQAPDGDAVGSSLALFHYLIKKGKEVTVIVPDAPPSFLNWMEGYNFIHVFENEEQFCKEKFESADIIFSLDYNDLKRVGQMGNAIAQSAAYKCMIDHHLYPSDFANYMLSNTNVGSTAQLIFQFIEEMGDKLLIDKIIAEGIYTGILTDTGSFRFPSVDAQTHLIAAYLISLGLKHARIHENIYDTNTVARLSFLGFALNQRLKVLPDLPVALITLTLEDAKNFSIEKGDTEGLVNWALSIKGMEMAAFIREDKDKIKLSFRSKGDVAVNEFSASYFEGGGHKNAAGGVSYLTLEETILLFEEKVYGFMEK
jgi:bifunctional oligoribonuclease and PAP phosphatase NrnA